MLHNQFFNFLTIFNILLTSYESTTKSTISREIITNLSNVNKPDQWIFRVDRASEIEHDNSGIFYTYGISNADTIAPKCTDDFFGLNINPFPLFENEFSTFFISSYQFKNGYVSFGIGSSSPDPSYFQSLYSKTIASFWSDIQTVKCGDIFYRETTNNQTLNMISKDT